MKNIVWLMILGAALFVILSSCNPALTLSSQDAGRSVDVKLGDTISIMLEANPSTGYTWELAPDVSTTLRMSGQPTYTANGPVIPGSSGQMNFRFSAVTPGKTTLKLIYHRPWEKNVAPIQVFDLNVNVN